MKAIVPIIGLVIVVVFMVVIYNGITAFNTKRVSQKDVWKQAQLITTDLLLSPKTAQYPKLGERGVEVENRGDSTYWVKGFVDSANGMGVPVRTRFEAVIQCLGANKWKTVSYDTEEAKAIRKITEDVTKAFDDGMKQVNEITAKAEAEQQRAERQAQIEAAQLEAQQRQLEAQQAQPAPQPASNWGGSQ